MLFLLGLLLALPVENKTPAENGTKVVMLLDDAIVHRPARAVDRKRFADLAGVVVVAGDPPAKQSELAKRFGEAARAKPRAFGEDQTLFLLAAGPMLDGPDKVLPRSFIRRKDQLELEILHTAARLQGMSLRRNIRWRPVVQVPLKLPPGRFRIRVVWQAVAALPKGKALKAPPKISSAQIEILPQKPDDRQPTGPKRPDRHGQGE